MSAPDLPVGADGTLHVNQPGADGATLLTHLARNTRYFNDTPGDLTKHLEAVLTSAPALRNLNWDVRDNSGASGDSGHRWGLASVTHTIPFS